MMRFLSPLNYKSAVIFILLLCFALTLMPLPGRVQAATFQVNFADDMNDGTCDATHCSLREAINAANVLAGTDTITFNIPGGGVQTIQPTTPLPLVTSPVTIDGTTQPGYAVGAPAILLSGASAVTSTVPPDPPIDLVGINIFGASNVTVRGLVLNGWGYGGVGILNGNNNIIEGNLIGTNAAGTAAVPNLYGVIIYNGSNNRVGGTTPAQRNLISGNNDDGVNIGGQTSAQAVANLALGNYIGTNAAGTAALGNGDDGVKVEIADGTIIGGTAAGARNIIAASNNNGVILKGANTINSLVQGNFIGTDVTGTLDLGNNLHGIFLEESPDNIIGGTAAGAGNRIAFSGGSGVHVTGATATANAILGNSIFANGGLGIDLNGVGITPNDPGDADTGANNLQNFPVVTSGGPYGGGTTINGALNSQPSQTYRLEFFANAACDPSGNGEGQTYLGFTNVTTNGSGDGVFSANLAVVTSTGQFITATAADPNNNTSEFSACVPVVVISAPAAAPVRSYFNTPTVPLSWSAVTYATGYIVQWDDNNAFSSPVTEPPLLVTQLATSITVPGDGVYYWRVRATNTAGTITPYSPTQSFTVDVP